MARKTKIKKKASDDDASEVEPIATRARRVSRRAPRTRQNGGKRETSAIESDVDVSGEESDEYINSNEDGEEDDVVSLDSDALDDPDFDASVKKRKHGSGSNKSSPKKKSRSSTKSPTKMKKRVPDSDDEEEELKDGQEFVGTVVQAPKTGRVPPGRISHNTFNFLKQLQHPNCNDRTWFKLHEPVFRQAEKEWKDFVDELTPLLTEADPEIPILPPNDIIYRIYRDIRFSNDKTPYKTNFSASFSRSGRKGTFAGYHVLVQPGGNFFAAGTWCPGKNELQTIRNNILRSPRRLRQVISAPAFVELFGEPKPHPKGQRRNIFGMDDELKTAPKGVDKTHKDIDLLKCRSFVVGHSLTDEDVLNPNFKEEVKRIVAIAQPFVHCLNDMMTIAPNADESETESHHEEGGVEDGEDD